MKVRVTFGRVKYNGAIYETGAEFLVQPKDEREFASLIGKVVEVVPEKASVDAAKAAGKKRREPDKTEPDQTESDHTEASEEAEAAPPDIDPGDAIVR